jgi:Zn-finger nucleic acid-binding protein
MNCPNCSQALTTTTVHDLEVELCSNCGGTWYGQDELNEMKNASLPDANWLDFDLWKYTDSLKFEWGEHACPVCSQPMVQVEYNETKVFIDACPKHHGVYLDKGEFEAILNALENEIIEKDLPDYLRAEKKFYLARKGDTRNGRILQPWCV